MSEANEITMPDLTPSGRVLSDGPRDVRDVFLIDDGRLMGSTPILNDLPCLSDLYVFAKGGRPPDAAR